MGNAIIMGGGSVTKVGEVTLKDKSNDNKYILCDGGEKNIAENPSLGPILSISNISYVRRNSSPPYKTSPIEYIDGKYFYGSGAYVAYSQDLITWETTTNFANGKVRKIFKADDGIYAFVVTQYDNCLVYKSVDGGKTFVYNNTNIPKTFYINIFIHKLNGIYVLATQYRILTSTDMVNWVERYNDSTAGYIRSTIEFKGELYVCADNKLIITNNGLSYTTVQTPIQYASHALKNKDNLFLSHTKGIYQSSDGRSFNKIFSVETISTSYTIADTVSFYSLFLLYIGSHTSGSIDNYVYTTSDMKNITKSSFRAGGDDVISLEEAKKILHYNSEGLDEYMIKQVTPNYAIPAYIRKE